MPDSIILASNSPRRSMLLSKLDIPFSVITSHFDEGTVTESDPIKYAIAAASGKAKEVFLRCGQLCLGADTVVFACGQILGKPDSPLRAREMLRLLSNGSHTVITGICLIGDGVFVQDYATTTVVFSDLSDIADKYIASGAPFDKAGGYGIQDELIKNKVISIDGSLDNVIGLPAELVKKHLQLLQK